MIVDEYKRKHSSEEESQDENDANQILGNDQSSNKHVVKRDMDKNLLSPNQSGIVIMSGFNNEEAIIEYNRGEEVESQNSRGSSYKPKIYDENQEDRQSKSSAITDKRAKKQHKVIQIEYFNQKNKPIQNYNQRQANNYRSNYDYNSSRNPTQYNNHNYNNFNNNYYRNNNFRQRNRYQNQNERYEQTNYPYPNHNQHFYQNRYHNNNYRQNGRQNQRGQDNRNYQNNYYRGNNRQKENNNYCRNDRNDRQSNNINSNNSRSNPPKNTNLTIDQQENQNQNTYLMNQAQQSIQINNSNNKEKNKEKEKQSDQSSDWGVQDNQNNQKDENQQVQANINDSLSLQIDPLRIHKNNALDQENSRNEEDLSLLNALDPHLSKKDQKQEQEGIQDKKIQEVLSIQKINQLLSTSIAQSKSIFNQQQLQTLNELFDKFNQIQPKKVEIKVKCSNVQSYIIKTISSEIYGIKNQKPDSLKDNDFIKILECKKNVPRDSQPNGSNQQIPHQQNKDNKIIEKKINKIILAQIKYPLDLLEISQEIAQLNDEKYNKVIDLIRSHSKNLQKQESLLKIQQISLICSICSDRKKHNWNGDPIVHPCVKQCANILRFQIQSMHFC